MKNIKIKISKEINLPLEVVTQTIAILAKRRAGKSYTMRRLVEQLFEAGQQVILVFQIQQLQPQLPDLNVLQTRSVQTTTPALMVPVSLSLRVPGISV